MSKPPTVSRRTWLQWFGVTTTTICFGSLHHVYKSGEVWTPCPNHVITPDVDHPFVYNSWRWDNMPPCDVIIVQGGQRISIPHTVEACEVTPGIQLKAWYRKAAL